MEQPEKPYITLGEYEILRACSGYQEAVEKCKESGREFQKLMDSMKYDETTRLDHSQLRVLFGTREEFEKWIKGIG